MKLKEFTYFYPEKPQLILINSDAFEKFSNDDDYVAQPKFNEQRCELHLIDGVGHFWDRHGKELTYNTNPAYAEGKKEIVRILVDKFGDRGYFQFDAGLRHNKVPGIKNKLVIYDIFVYKNEVLNRLIYDERRDILKRYFEKRYFGKKVWMYDMDDTVHLINQHPNDFQRHFNEYTASGDVDESYPHPEEFEGLVMKSKKGMLRLGRVSGADSTWMFKVRIQTGRHRY